MLGGPKFGPFGDQNLPGKRSYLARQQNDPLDQRRVLEFLPRLNAVQRTKRLNQPGRWAWMKCFAISGGVLSLQPIEVANGGFETFFSSGCLKVLYQG